MASKEAAPSGFPIRQSHPPTSSYLSDLDDFLWTSLPKSDFFVGQTLVKLWSDFFAKNFPPDFATKVTMRFHGRMAKHGRTNGYGSFHHEGLRPSHGAKRKKGGFNKIFAKEQISGTPGLSFTNWRELNPVVHWPPLFHNPQTVSLTPPLVHLLCHSTSQNSGKKSDGSGANSTKQNPWIWLFDPFEIETTDAMPSLTPPSAPCSGCRWERAEVAIPSGFGLDLPFHLAGYIK